MAIYELDVTDDQYENIAKKIDDISHKSKGYNIIGLICAIWKKRLNRNKYYCSEFVYNVLSDENVKLVSKDDEIFRPIDFLCIEGLQLIYEGKISEYLV